MAAPERGTEPVYFHNCHQSSSKHKVEFHHDMGPIVSLFLYFVINKLLNFEHCGYMFLRLGANEKNDWLC